MGPRRRLRLNVPANINILPLPPRSPELNPVENVWQFLRDLPEEFGKWGSVYRQFRRWTLAGLWETILEVLNASEAVPDSVQMIDTTIVRAHHCAAGARGGLRARISAARRVASRPRSISAPMAMACP